MRKKVKNDLFDYENRYIYQYEQGFKFSLDSILIAEYVSNFKNKNILAIAVDNSPNDFVYPQMADFTFYGGIYRDVKLIGVEEKHFDLDYYGAPGLTVTPVVNGTNADVNACAYCDGEVEFTVLANGEAIASKIASGKNPSVDFIIENKKRS